MKADDLTGGVTKFIPLIYLAGFLIVLFVVYKLLSSIGIIKSPKKKRELRERKEAVNMLRTDEYFDATYHEGKKFKSLGDNTAEVYAQKIRKAIRGAGTNEEEIYSTFGKLYNKCNVSEVADSYFRQYKRDLQADLLNDLNEKEITDLMNIINGLPNF